MFHLSTILKPYLTWGKEFSPLPASSSLPVTLKGGKRKAHIHKEPGFKETDWENCSPGMEYGARGKKLYHWERDRNPCEGHILET